MKPGDTVTLAESGFLWDREMLKSRKFPGGSRFTVVALSPRGDFVTARCEREGCEVYGIAGLFAATAGAST